MSEKPTPERHISARKKSEDQGLDGLLRPQQLDDFTGQEKLKANLTILIEAAKGRQEPLDHILFHGPPGLGKCVTKDNLILTAQGLVPFSELIPTDLQPGEYTPCEVEVYGRDGPERASHIYNNGRSPTILLRTRSGFELEGTPNHPILVATSQGPQWKQLGDLTTDDFVAIARNTEAWGEQNSLSFQPSCLDNSRRQAVAEQRTVQIHRALTQKLERPPTTPELTYLYAGEESRNPTPYITAKRLNLPLTDGRKFPGNRINALPYIVPTPSIEWNSPRQLDGDLAYLIGLLIGDRHFEVQTAPAFAITVTEKEIQEEVIRICLDKFGWSPNIKQYGAKAPKIYFSQNFGHFIQYLKVKPALAAEKEVPPTVLTGTADVARGFLQGLFDADGQARMDGYVDWCSKSKTLSIQVQLILANFGIIAHRTSRRVKGQTYWQLFIGGRDARLFYERIGFRLSRKQERAEFLMRATTGVSRSDQIPFADIVLKELLYKTGPHPRQLHKLFDHVKRGDRKTSSFQVAKLLAALPPTAETLPPARVLEELCNPQIYWDRVIEVGEGEAEVYDFVVPGTHSFVGNGFYNHNTTLAHVVANEMNVNIRITAGPAIERAGDLAAILTNLRAGDILFIDEVHRLGRAVEEILYPAMEDFVLDIVVGKGPGAKNVRLKLPRFTVIGATTRLALLTAPLRARFGAQYRMDFYELEAIESIVVRGAGILGVKIEPVGSVEIARRSRGTPRVALRLLRRVRDYVQVRAEGDITGDTAVAALDLLEIDELGLDDLDRRVLRAIIDKFGGGPVGLDTIAASISEESDTIMDVVEPYLLQLGFLERTARGRVATPHAYRHLGIPMPSEVVDKPIQPGLFSGES